MAFTGLSSFQLMVKQVTGCLTDAPIGLPGIFCRKIYTPCHATTHNVEFIARHSAQNSIRLQSNMPHTSLRIYTLPLAYFWHIFEERFLNFIPNACE